MTTDPIRRRTRSIASLSNQAKVDSYRSICVRLRSCSHDYRVITPWPVNKNRYISINFRICGTPASPSGRSDPRNSVASATIFDRRIVAAPCFSTYDNYRLILTNGAPWYIPTRHRERQGRYKSARGNRNFSFKMMEFNDFFVASNPAPSVKHLIPDASIDMPVSS